MLFEQRRKWLGGNVQLLAQLAESSNANECGGAKLDDGAARCASSERGRERRSWRFDALFAADGTLADAQSHWRKLIQRKDRAVRTQDVNADNKGKRETLHHKQQMMHCHASDFNKQVNIPANLSASASNAKDIRPNANERLNRGSVAQSTVHSAAQHLECYARVDKRVCNAHSSNRSLRKDLRGDFSF